MIRGIDHLVIAVADLEAAVKDYKALGFTVVPGGRHTGIGTYNALIAFADGAYLELIGFSEPRADHRWWAPLQKGGGLVDFCLQTDDLAADARAFRAAGVAMGEPEPRDRQRPDGFEVRWRFALAAEPQRGVAPFIIADETPRDERVPRARSHENGVTGIGTLTVAVEDVDTVEGWYARALGRPGQRVERHELDAAGVRFAVGPHVLDFVTPRGAGAASLTEWLRTRGPSPYAATLRSEGREVGPLDDSRTHGARLALV